MTESSLRVALAATALAAQAAGLNRGTSGNLSVRCGDGLLITPSGMPADRQTPDDMVYLDGAGTPRGPRKPSSEWRFHRDIFATRPEFTAILHAHSPFATALACLGRDIPPFHYMIAAAGGKTLRCAPYALFGSQALSDAALAAMVDRKACLLANHGMIAASATLEGALALALEIETLCEQYCHAMQVGIPVILSDADMDAVLAKFNDYGQRG